MAEYIKREDVLELAKRGFIVGNRNYSSVVAFINDIPSADVRPVVRGRWKDAIQNCNDSPHVKCSVCGEYYWQYFKKFNFCPNCGADMRGDNDV